MNLHSHPHQEKKGWKEAKTVERWNALKCPEKFVFELGCCKGGKVRRP